MQKNNIISSSPGETVGRASIAGLCLHLGKDMSLLVMSPTDF